jgi:nucleoside phosphorylase
MCSDKFEAFRSQAEPRGKESSRRLEDFLLQRRRGQPLDPRRVTLETGLDADDVLDLLEIASDQDVGLLERADVIRCPNGGCGAAEIVEPLIRQERSEGEARCSVCEEVIANPAIRQSERRYQLTLDGDREAKAAQAARPSLVAAVLTALPEELGAVRDQLVSEGSEVAEEVVDGGAIYYKASLRGDHVDWTVYAAYTEATPASAAAGTADILINFRPMISLYVGIAGGIAEKGVKLGDVVAATEVYDYDGGKEGAKGFLPRPRQFHAAHGLKQRASFTMLDETWREHLRDVVPGLALDAPAIHIEPIAAGSKVIANTDSKTYELVRETADRAVAVEMEGSGFLGAVHRYGTDAIIVRGISDLIDGKDQADRDGVRKQAEANAAGFACALLRRYAPSPNTSSG